MKGYLQVQAEGSRYGFRVGDVEQVMELVSVQPAPGVVAAVRGVTVASGRTLPVVHLVALLTMTTPPQPVRSTGVIVTCGDASVVFEVDDVDSVIPEDPLPVPEGWRIPWASGVAPGHRLVPILDVSALAERLHASTARQYA